MACSVVLVVYFLLHFSDGWHCEQKELEQIPQKLPIILKAAKTHGLVDSLFMCAIIAAPNPPSRVQLGYSLQRRMRKHVISWITSLCARLLLLPPSPVSSSVTPPNPSLPTPEKKNPFRSEL